MEKFVLNMRKSNVAIQLLRAKICGLMLAGQRITQKISKSSGKQKDLLWTQKRELGNSCRNYLIAYGLLRGREYKQIERPSIHNKPNAHAIFSIVKKSMGYRFKSITLEDIRVLLDNSKQVDSGNH